MLDWETIARAEAHPLRLAILELMLTAPPDGDLGWSAKTLAPLIDPAQGHLAHIAYHVRALRDAGLLVEVDKRQVRGAMQTFYRISSVAIGA